MPPEYQRPNLLLSNALSHPGTMPPLQAYRGICRKLVLGIDVGTTYSGIAYAFLDPGEIPQIHGVTRYVHFSEHCIFEIFIWVMIVSLGKRMLRAIQKSPLFYTTVKMAQSTPSELKRLFLEWSWKQKTRTSSLWSGSYPCCLVKPTTISDKDVGSSYISGRRDSIPATSNVKTSPHSRPANP